MNRIIKYSRLIGLAAIFGMSNVTYATNWQPSSCTFDPDVISPVSAPDGVSDLRGQGYFKCADFIGSDGAPMTKVTGVIFQRNGNWKLPESKWELDSNELVTNTPDHVVLFPRPGRGARCDYSYFRVNAVQGAGLDIGGNASTWKSIACTDGLVNNNEVPLPETAIITSENECEVVLIGEGGKDITGEFDFFTGGNLEGTQQTLCSADGTPQNECVRGCPEFIDIDALGVGVCQPDVDGNIPLEDNGQRCTPCLTAAQAKVELGYDTGGLKFCWEYTNRVNDLKYPKFSVDEIPGLNPGPPPGYYKPHKSIRSQTSQTELYNACYTTTTTINFFGREIVKTFTTCR